MGGQGSGRHCSRQRKWTVEELQHCSLSIGSLRGLEPGTGPWYITWRSNGEAVAIAALWIGDRLLCIKYKRLSEELSRYPLQSIQLDTTACNYGGRRLWFRCPNCDQRVARIIFLGHPFRRRFFSVWVTIANASPQQRESYDARLNQGTVGRRSQRV